MITNEIAIPAGYTFEPIGTSQAPFTGTLDGGGYRITGLNVQPGSSFTIGLFGTIKSSDKDTVAVQDLKLYGANISGDLSLMGALVGDLDTGTVKNISVLGGDVTTTRDYAGGIAGKVGSDGVIMKGYVSASVEGNRYIGGLTGQNRGYVSGKFEGSVTASGHSGGGLVGHNLGTVIGQAMGTVSGTETIGGMIGQNQQTATSSVLGYSTGAVTGNSIVGAVIGFTSTDYDLFAYFDPTTTGLASGIGANTAGAQDNMTIHGISISSVVWNASQGNYVYQITSGNHPVFHLANFLEYFTVTETDPGNGSWPELKPLN